MHKMRFLNLLVFLINLWDYQNSKYAILLLFLFGFEHCWEADLGSMFVDHSCWYLHARLDPGLSYTKYVFNF